MRPCNITPAVILHILNEMRQCNITPIIKEYSYTNVILHGRFQKKFRFAAPRLNPEMPKAPASAFTLPSVCAPLGLRASVATPAEACAESQFNGRIPKDLLRR
jgi:hypothetical protein